MNFLNNLTNTPLWVWAILVFFIDIGLKSIHQHVVYIPRLFLMPVVITILKYQDILLTNTTTVLAVLFLLVGCIIGLFFTRHTLITFDKKAWTVQVPGSYVTFLFLILFFSIKLLFEYLEKIDQSATEKYFLAETYFLVDAVISALFAGYFLGRACVFSYKFYKQR